MNPGTSSRGLGVIEVVVVLVLVSLVALAVVMILPRQRESSRRLNCRMNLSRIGQTVLIYSQLQRRLPGVPELGPDASPESLSPLATLIEFAGEGDFATIRQKREGPIAPANAKKRAEVAERHVPGFVCPSDPTASSALWKCPVSYRANTGDTPEGRTGPFAPGKTVSLEEIQAADGASYTALFAERLVGNGLNEPHTRNYQVVAGPIGPDACPVNEKSFWKGNAGSSWLPPDWRSTLYNHARPPGSTPSCVAADERSAHMGASSGHLEGVQVLMADGSVQLFTLQVDAKLWKRFGNFHDGE